MTIQKEEENQTSDANGDDDNIDQESFHTCGNEQNANLEDQEQQASTTLELGENTTVDTNVKDDQSKFHRVKPLISSAKKETTTEGSLLDALQIPSFIKIGLEKKQTARAIKSWAALALTLDGRDKITKVLQYISRFLGWYLAGGSLKTQSLRFNAVYKALATSRKAFRLGRSLIEIEKLRPIPGMILWHLQDEEDRVSTEGRKLLTHQASSIIGLAPETMVEEMQSQRSLLRSLGSVTYQRIYRPLLSRMSSTMLPDDSPTQELWKICGMSVKILGLLFFWAGDNCNFLLSTGAFDDYSITMEERLKRRKQRQAFFSKKANQSYFFGSLAGLLVNWYAYVKFHRESIEELQEYHHCAADPGAIDVWAQKVKQLKQKQFSLFLSLLKVCSYCEECSI